MVCETADVLADLPAGPAFWTGVAAAEDALARLDERLRASPVRDGWIARADLLGACASLYLAGELVHVEDLALHDAETDVRLASHALARAQEVLRERRRIAAAAPGAALARRLAAGRSDAPPGESLPPPSPDGSDDDPLAAELAAIDAAIARSTRLLSAGADRRESPERTPVADIGREFVYSEDWDEAAGLAEWRAVCERTADLPPTLAAAIAYEAWRATEPLQRQGWLGTLLVDDLLRARGKARAHLPCLDVGLREIPRERRRHMDRAVRLAAVLEALTAAARVGLAELDRLAAARAVLARRLAGRRGNSKLPALVDLVLSSPLVTAPMAARELDVSPWAAQKLLAELGLRELTGRRRFRAWGV